MARSMDIGVCIAATHSTGSTDQLCNFLTTINYEKGVEPFAAWHAAAAPLPGTPGDCSAVCAARELARATVPTTTQ